MKQLMKSEGVLNTEQVDEIEAADEVSGGTAAAEAAPVDSITGAS